MFGFYKILIGHNHTKFGVVFSAHSPDTDEKIRKFFSTCGFLGSPSNTMFHLTSENVSGVFTKNIDVKRVKSAIYKTRHNQSKFVLI